MKKDLERDLKKLADAFYSELLFEDSCEYGSPGLDCKRPFGNSDVEGDILEILGFAPEGDDGDSSCYSRDQRDYARRLYTEELIPYLKQQWRLLKDIKKSQGIPETSEIMVLVPLELLKSVLEAAEDNNLDCLNALLNENAGYMGLGRNMTLKKMYEDEKEEIDKLKKICPDL